MPFAVKIGEIELRSDKPITQKQRNAAIKMLKGEEPMPSDLADGLEVKNVFPPY